MFTTIYPTTCAGTSPFAPALAVVAVAPLATVKAPTSTFTGNVVPFAAACAAQVTPAELKPAKFGMTTCTLEPLFVMLRPEGISEPKLALRLFLI
jgi:hypothetical protein